MTPPVSMGYVEAKSRVVHGIDRITSFIAAAGEYKADPQNTAKRAKIEQMVRHLNEICRNVEANIQLMETAVSHGTTPTDITDTKYSRSLSSKFDNLYYDVAAFMDVHHIPISPYHDHTLSSTVNQSTYTGNLSHY